MPASSATSLPPTEYTPPPILKNRLPPSTFPHHHDQASTSTHHDRSRPIFKPPSSMSNDTKQEFRPCSVCKQSFPTALPPRSITYAELQSATGNFGQNSFLIEGESEFIYKGVLEDGDVVAIKTCSTQEYNKKFDSEKKILRVAQHPNVITLIGFCNEAGKSMLVYSFACNGTLDWHLSSRNPNIMEWEARRSVAIQIARGLHYLHEKCQIVHGDIRPKNILLTHDFLAMISGFKYAKWHHSNSTSDKCEANTLSRYGAAQEKTDNKEITEKEDTYAFGVLLLELISGRIAYDVSRPAEQRSLVDWARSMLEDLECVIKEILDPRLKHHYNHYELCTIVNAASLCIRKDPSARPRMKQILGNLEDAKDSVHFQNYGGANDSGVHPRAPNQKNGNVINTTNNREHRVTWKDQAASEVAENLPVPHSRQHKRKGTRRAGLARLSYNSS